MIVRPASDLYIALSPVALQLRFGLCVAEVCYI